MINNKDSVLTKLQNDPNNYDLNLQLGLFFVNEKNYSEAKNIFKKLISLNQNRYEGFLNLSKIFEIYNKLDKSEKILKKYINKNKYNKEIISGLAILYYNSGNYKKLHIIINQYIEFEENHILFFLKGFLYENDNKVEKQILFLQKSINTNRNFWPAYEKLFNALERSNKINEFYKLVIQSNERFQNELKLSYYLALCLFRKNERQCK